MNVASTRHAGDMTSATCIFCASPTPARAVRSCALSQVYLVASPTCRTPGVQRHAETNQVLHVQWNRHYAHLDDGDCP